MNINIETTTVQQATSEQLDILAKYLCGVKLTLQDSGVPVADVDNVSQNGVSVACSTVYKDTVDALADKGINVTYNTEYIRILDPTVRQVLVSNNIGDANGVPVSLAATAVFNSIFVANANIVNFDEFKYFTTANANAPKFKNCTSLTSIDLTNCTKYASDCFDSCSNLTYFHGINSEAGVLRIAEGATGIGGYDFRKVYNLTTVYLPDSLTSIGYGCFSDCTGLTEVHFGTGINSIQTNAMNVQSITSVYIKDLDRWLDVDFQGPVSPSHHLYLESNGISTEITNVDFTGKTAINKNVLYGASYITDVTLPTDITSIEDYAFYNCSNLVIPQLYLPSLTSIGSNAFKGTKVQAITNLGAISTIPESCFKGCSSLSSVVIPSTVATIGNQAFNGCTNLVISDLNLPNVTALGTESFRGTKIQIISDLGNITEITNYCFSEVSTVTSIVIPNSVTKIGNYAFKKCSSLTSINIPNSVTSIGFQAFTDCSSLISITIPDSITEIGVAAFLNCNSMTSATINAVTPPTLAGSTAFQNNNNNYPIYVPAGSVSAYQSAPQWSTLARRIQAIPT